MSSRVLRLYALTVAEGVKLLEEQVDKLEAENKRLKGRLRSVASAKSRLRRRQAGGGE